MAQWSVRHCARLCSRTLDCCREDVGGSFVEIGEGVVASSGRVRRVWGSSWDIANRQLVSICDIVVPLAPRTPPKSPRSLPESARPLPILSRKSPRILPIQRVRRSGAQWARRGMVWGRSAALYVNQNDQHLSAAVRIGPIQARRVDEAHVGETGESLRTRMALAWPLLRQVLGTSRRR